MISDVTACVAKINLANGLGLESCISTLKKVKVRNICNKSNLKM